MTDVQLAQQAMTGNHEAFEQLYRKYNALVHNSARRLTRSRHAADEVAAEVWFWLVDGRWRLDEAATRADGQLHGFVATLAMYAVRHRSYRPSIDQHTVANHDDDGSVLARLRSARPDPELRLLRLDIRRHVVEALRRLPPHHRRVAQLRYVDELTCREIATRIGVQTETIPGYLFAIRAQLRRALAPHIPLRPKGTRQSRGGHQRFARRSPSRDDSPSPRTPADDGSPSQPAITSLTEV